VKNLMCSYVEALVAC